MSIHQQYQKLNTLSRHAHRNFMEAVPDSINASRDFHENYFGSVCTMAEIIGSKQVSLEKQHPDAETQLALAEQQLRVTLRYIYRYFRTEGLECATADSLMAKLREVIQCEKASAKFRNQHGEALVESF